MQKLLHGSDMELSVEVIGRLQLIEGNMMVVQVDLRQHVSVQVVSREQVKEQIMIPVGL